MTCKTCKYWQARNPEQGMCESNSVAFRVNTGPGNPVFIFTASDFGCAFFERRVLSDAEKLETILAWVDHYHNVYPENALGEEIKKVLND